MTNLQLTGSEVAVPTFAESRPKDCRTGRSGKSRMSMCACRQSAAESRLENPAEAVSGQSGLFPCARDMLQAHDTRYLRVAWSRQPVRQTNLCSSQGKEIRAMLWEG